jgi:hypothetical protein
MSKEGYHKVCRVNIDSLEAQDAAFACSQQQQQQQQQKSKPAMHVLLPSSVATLLTNIPTLYHREC